MHILNIIQCTNLGGMERSALALLTELRGRGHRVEMLSLNSVGGLGPLLEQHGIPVDGIRYRGRGGWQSLPELKRRLATVNPEALVMTGHNLLAMLALGDLCADRRLLMIHFHHEGVMPRWKWRLIYRVALRRFSAITFPSDFVRREAESIHPPVASASHTVSNPIVLAEAPSEAQRIRARRKLGISGAAWVVGNAGWLIPRKRFDVFLRVAQGIAREEPSTLFLIAGDGPEKIRLEALAKDLGIAERIRWLGWQRELESFYACLDLLVFNSDWDAMGLTPLEALSAGVPVVASVANGGLPEILDRSYGLVLREHDINRLTRESLGMLRNREAAQSRVQAGRCRISKVASVAGYTDRVSRLLRVTEGGCDLTVGAR
jgi:glycosyltransferase involved in cell wall biosynthesis